MQSATNKSRPQDGSAKSVANKNGENKPNTIVLSAKQMLFIPLAFTLALFLVSFLPRIQSNDTLVFSFWGACAALLLWSLVLYFKTSSSGKLRSFTIVRAKPQHYLQAMLHLTVFAYWGTVWVPVQNYALLLVAQLLFAYAFDLLLSWSKRDTYFPGFGPFPIIFSTNLFLWFRDDWFYLQFIMVAVGFLGKEYVRWNRDGRMVHIFNPSAFTLGLFSLVLLVTGSTDITWGAQIASTLSLAPGIYTYLFVVGLVVMYAFSITLVAASAAMVLFGLSALYFSITGVPYFLDSEIPIAVFLGLHLLVTDPSTSPRTPSGKLVFGILYGMGVFVLYTVLDLLGTPTFYDKLLCVPLLNLSVQWIDRMVLPLRNNQMLERLGLGVTPSRRTNLGHMAVWVVFFAAMSMMGKTDSRHVGDSLPFWAQACEEGRVNACKRLLLLESTYCADNSGWACNEIGAHYYSGEHVAADPELASSYFSRACDLRFQAGCLNFLDPSTIIVAEPRVFDLRLLLREGGLNLMDMSEPDLYSRACEHGWTYACPNVTSL